MNVRNCVIVLLSVAFIGGCSRTEPEFSAALPLVDPLDRVAADEVVLATVGGSRIGASDLTLRLARTLGDDYGQLVDVNVEQTMLESMIASRALALEALGEMDEFERVSLEKRVAQFYEELLVKRYLVAHADGGNVTADQVTAYYKANPKEFAGNTTRVFEVVTVSPDTYRRDSVAAIAAVSRAKTHDDWSALAVQSAATSDGLRLGHGVKTLIGDQADGPIEAAVLELASGQKSRVIISDGAPYIVRLVEQREDEPESLASARADIRRKLLPRSVRDSVRALSEEVLARTVVTRLHNPVTD